MNLSRVYIVVFLKSFYSRYERIFSVCFNVENFFLLQESAVTDTVYEGIKEESIITVLRPFQFFKEA